MTALFSVLDYTASILLASSCAFHSRQCGNQLAGSVSIAFICAISAFIFRDAVLHGQAGVVGVLNLLPPVTLVAATLGGIAGKYDVAEKWHDLAYLTGVGILASWSTLCAIRTNNLGIAASVSVGWIIGTIPGCIRDVGLGDVASFIEQRWFASALFLAILSTLGIGCCLVFLNQAWLNGDIWQLVSVSCGTVIFLILNFFSKKD